MSTSLTYTNRPQKIRLARYAYNPVFGEDVDVRENMSDADALARFEDVWMSGLAEMVVQTKPSDSSDEALKILSDKEKEFFKRDQQHRVFRYKGGLFVAQLLKSNNDKPEVTQLWFGRSSDTDPRTLYIKFPTVHQRDEFEVFAKQLGYIDRDLGRLLLLDLMHNSQAADWQTILGRVFSSVAE